MAEPPAIASLDPHRPVRVWLAVVWAAILAMVVVGGITRLTGSGLSMVEWQPLIGAIPPLSEADWLEVFAKYQRTPQFAQVNHWMELEDFKRIFFWEYLHRLLGRAIGAVFLVPWLIFVVRGRLRGRWAVRSAVAFVLGGLQGVLGWFMVASGLVQQPEVSHYRLAAHLGLAFFVAAYVQWLYLDLAAPVGAAAAPAPRRPWLRRAGWALLALLALQIVYGALMAGKRAGLVFSTFPTMNGQWVPDGAFAVGDLATDLLDNPVGIHFVHRTLAWLVAAAALAWAAAAARSAELRRPALALAAIVVAQVALGAATVLSQVALGWAVAHQALALLLLAAALGLLHRLGRGARSNTPA